jgi:hypothetical protein
MATAVSYPGVYIEEVPSSVRAIAGVATSVAAFIGYTARGPTNEPVQIFSFADFERRFGGLDLDSDLSYAVSHFFLNGGSQGWIVRVAAGAAAAAISLRNDPPGGAVAVLTATARSAGIWGNNLQLLVDYDTANPASLFNLTIQEVQDRNGRPSIARSEIYRNLSMNSHSPAYAVDVVNAASNLVTLERPGGLAFGPAATAFSGVIAEADLDRLGDNARRLAIALDGGPAMEFDFLAEGDALAGANFNDRMDNLAERIEIAVRALDPGDDAFADFACIAHVNAAEAVLEATSGTPADRMERSSVAFSTASRRSAAGILRLGSANGGRETGGAAALRPAATGTTWPRQDPPLDFGDLGSPTSIDVDLVDAAGTVLFHEVIPLWGDAAGRPADLAHLRTQLQAAFARSARREFAGARVIVNDDRITVIPGGGGWRTGCR